MKCIPCCSASVCSCFVQGGVQPVRVPLTQLPPVRSTPGVKKNSLQTSNPGGKECPPRAGRQREVATLYDRDLQLLELSRMGHRLPLFWAILGSGWGGTVVGWPI